MKQSGSTSPVTAEMLRKRVRPGEFVVEKTIMGVALMSILFIVLICTFVFRESRGVFKKDEAAISQNAHTGNDAGASETYGDAGVSETYGDVGASETYGDAGASETYGEPASAPGEMSSMDSAAAMISASEHNDNQESAFKSLFGMEWMPISSNQRYGLLPLFIGSLKIALIAILFGAPIAIGAALYTSTFAGKRAKELLKPAIELLAGFPSVVIGFFSLMVVATVMQSIFQWPFRLNAVVGGIAMSLAIIPVIYTISEDALVSVPKSISQAALALGATKWETALTVVLPAAVPGIFAAILLGIGRAIGETMIALMATGNAAIVSMIPWEPVRSMAAAIGAEMAEVVVGDMHYSVLFLLGVLLFAVSFVLNLIVEFFVRGYLMRRFKGI